MWLIGASSNGLLRAYATAGKLLANVEVPASRIPEKPNQTSRRT
jgi:hypothetical protein